MHQDQLLILFLLLLLLRRSFSIAVENNQCTASCGEIKNISYPFRLRGYPKFCGHKNYELACISNRTIMTLKSGELFVRSINYTNYRIVLVDAGLQRGNCSSLPLYSFSYSNDFPRESGLPCPSDLELGPPSHKSLRMKDLVSWVTIVGCTKAIHSPLYIDASSCLDGLQFSNLSTTRRLTYAMVDAKVSSVETECTIEGMAVSKQFDDNGYRSYAQIHEGMVNGTTYSWHRIACEVYCPSGSCNMVSDGQIFCESEQDSFAGKISRYLGSIVEFIYIHCYVSVRKHFPTPLHYGFAFVCEHFNRYETFFYYEWCPAYLEAMLPLLDIVFWCIVLKFILGAPCVMLVLICKWRRRHLAMDQNVEEFLQSNNNFLPIRYSYSDIKKITGNLKDKLGEGAYGSVFKGRLRSGRDVAVKILKKGKANGQDFISEVATIGRIHHVNVVGLIGYCFDGSKQALVYDFMHNGSLDKHIFSQGEGTSLDCKEVYAIALGIARGIEYLHRGCEVQILHFDIKPHNILLDKDFIPKVSDFGLARLYPTDYKIVSLTDARGTFGYMAPELVYKNLGGVSYKADVYSFGKLLMEMATRRKNTHKVTGCSSHTYFPLWVHDQLSEGLDVPMEQATEEDKRIQKKMIIVALWCIQWTPSDRPSMRKVMEMLEREGDDLQVPPKPLFYPTETWTGDYGTCTDEANNTISTSSISVIAYEDSHLENISNGTIQV